jgi:hypothetical protein
MALANMLLTFFNEENERNEEDEMAGMNAKEKIAHLLGYNKSIITRESTKRLCRLQTKITEAKE